MLQIRNPLINPNAPTANASKPTVIISPVHTTPPRSETLLDLQPVVIPQVFAKKEVVKSSTPDAFVKELKELLGTFTEGGQGNPCKYDYEVALDVHALLKKHGL